MVINFILILSRSIYIIQNFSMVSYKIIENKYKSIAYHTMYRETCILWYGSTGTLRTLPVCPVACNVVPVCWIKFENIFFLYFAFIYMWHNLQKYTYSIRGMGERGCGSACPARLHCGTERSCGDVHASWSVTSKSQAWQANRMHASPAAAASHATVTRERAAQPSRGSARRAAVPHPRSAFARVYKHKVRKKKIYFQILLPVCPCLI